MTQEEEEEKILLSLLMSAARELIPFAVLWAGEGLTPIKLSYMTYLGQCL